MDTIDEAEAAEIDEELRQQYKVSMDVLKETDFKYRADREENRLKDKFQRALVY